MTLLLLFSSCSRLFEISGVEVPAIVDASYDDDTNHRDKRQKHTD